MLVNLHSHLEGRIRPATALELATALGLPEPPGGWAGALEVAEPGTLTAYLDKVGASYPFLADREMLTRVAREAVEDSAADGQDYLELRFGPSTHVRPGFDVDDVVDAACEGVAQGVAATGMPAGLVLAALRSHSDERNLAVARAAARRAGDGIVGFDLAGDELRFPAVDRYVPAFGIARAAGLGLTCHAAEAAPAAAALEAMDLLGVTRIGHGTRAATDPHVLAELAARGVVVEVCPTSNVLTGACASLADHPLPRFEAAGVGVVLGDDNPRQTRSTLSAERVIAAELLGSDEGALAALDRRAVGCAFLTDSERARLSAGLPASP
ncbi:adenosine deaminase [Pseudonocardia xishanensis]|uniref:adenosine deaminase n=1 Tax=Pseudonocardia xishanensis TaxID=630995 RepID=A0ABP8RI80_9PSEU